MTAERKIPTEIYDRCCGYYRPVKQFNKGKQEEASERKRAFVTDETLKGQKVEKTV